MKYELVCVYELSNDCQYINKTASELKNMNSKIILLSGSQCWLNKLQGYSIFNCEIISKTKLCNKSRHAIDVTYLK